MTLYSTHFSSSLSAIELAKMADLDRLTMPFPWSPQQWLDLAAEKRYFFGQIFISEKLIGFCLFYIPHPDEAELHKIGILKDARRHKLGRSLLNEALEQLRSSGVKSVFLEVQESNLGAVALYEGLGFKKSRTVRSFYSNGDTALIFSRALDT